MTRTPIRLAVAAGAALLVAGCSDDGTGTSTTTTTRTATATQSAPAYTGELPGRPAAGAPVDCSYTPDGGAAKDVAPPQESGVTTAGSPAVTMSTSAGPIGLTLDPAAAPCTVNSFVSLAGQGYFDDTPCHRLVTSPGLQVLQCGDPSGTGRGGPGYGFDTEYPETAYAPTDPALSQPVVYPRGTVAMANTGQPGSNGSQFFLVYEDSQLPPAYTIFGTIDEAGLATIEKVAAAGDDGSMGSVGGGAPNLPVQIESVTVTS